MDDDDVLSSGSDDSSSKERPKSPILDDVEEAMLADALALLAKSGKRLTLGELVEYVTAFARRVHPDRWRGSPPQQSLSGNWLQGFRQRWKHKLVDLEALVSPASIERVPSTMKMEERDAVQRFLTETWIPLLADKYPDIKAENVWNLDEASFHFINQVPHASRIGRGMALPAGMSHCSRRENLAQPSRSSSIRVMFLVNAGGTFHTPCFIFQNRLGRLSRDMLYGNNYSDFPDMGYAVTRNGWGQLLVTTTGLKLFATSVQASKTNPQIILMDSHLSHQIGLAGARELEDLGITIVHLPPQTGHLLQPLEQGLVRSMKQQFSRLAKAHAPIPGHTVDPSKYQLFEGWIYQATAAAMTPAAIKNGFQVTGIWPPNAEVVETLRYGLHCGGGGGDRGEEEAPEECSARSFAQEIEKFREQTHQRLEALERCLFSHFFQAQTLP